MQFMMRELKQTIPTNNEMEDIFKVLNGIWTDIYIEGIISIVGKKYDKGKKIEMFDGEKKLCIACKFSGGEWRIVEHYDYSVDFISNVFKQVLLIKE